MELREVTELAIVLRIFSAVLLGGLLGLERGLKNRPAGMRTYMLVCTGACLVMLTNQYVCQALQTGDPMRLGAQVVSGIGFLGAGTIIVTRHNQIKGLTTAASLWAAAGVGIALGIGFYEAAFTGSAAIFLVMVLLQSFDNSIHKRARRTELYVEFAPELSLHSFLSQVRKMGYDIHNIQQDGEFTEAGRAYILTLKSRKINHVQIVASIRGITGVNYLEEL